MSIKENQIRPPIVAIMGHVDHGKSTLLDYIQKTNVVDKEVGGITQKLSGYEAEVKDDEGKTRTITFIDTPGHAAFAGMREKGASVADIAILIVSAEDSVKAQTQEAIKTIKANNVPFIVAINKIDKPGANPEKVKLDLLENQVFIEGYGGDVSYAEISAKTGKGVNELLQLIILLADILELKGDEKKLAQGYVLESHLDPKRGICATLIIKEGSLEIGQTVLVGKSIAKLRLMEDFRGKSLKKATFSKPITVIGFETMPEAGSSFLTFETKKEAEEAMNNNKDLIDNLFFSIPESEFLVPLVIKADTSGSLEAISHELSHLGNKEINFKVIKSGIGSINESDLKIASSDPNSKGIIIGFNVGIDKLVMDSNDAHNVQIENFNIIYKLSEWLEEYLKKHKPKKETETILAKGKILKIFSQSKDKAIIGIGILEGVLDLKSRVRILRQDEFIGHMSISGLEHAKVKTNKVEAGNECGASVETKADLKEGDIIISYIVESK